LKFEKIKKVENQKFEKHEIEKMYFYKIIKLKDSLKRTKT
jgi:hypothetical protein